LTPEEHNALPDDAYALVLVNGDQVMKKFATIDSGNTALSVMYFLKTAHKLPEEAQKVAAQNLVAACGWYGLDAPELLKEAGKKKTAFLGVGIDVGSFAESDTAKGVINVGFPHLVSAGGRHKPTGLGLGIGVAGPVISWSPSTMRGYAEEQERIKKEEAAKKLTKGPATGEVETKEAMAQPYRKAKGVARYVQLMKGDRADAMEQFAKDRTKSVVLDLRGLGGGRNRMSKPSISFGKTRAEANANAAREAAKDQSRGKAWQKMNDLASDERVYSGATRAGTALGAVGAVGTATALASKSNKNTAEKGINEKNASVMFKEAFGALGLLSGALVIPEQARQAKMNLSATKGSGGAVMTPGQIQQRKAQMGMY